MDRSEKSDLLSWTACTGAITLGSQPISKPITFNRHASGKISEHFFNTFLHIYQIYNIYAHFFKLTFRHTVATTAAYMYLCLHQAKSFFHEIQMTQSVLNLGCTFYGIADASYKVIQVSRINSGCVLNAPQLLQTVTSLNIFSSQSVLFGLLHRMKFVAKQREKQ